MLIVSLFIVDNLSESFVDDIYKLEFSNAKIISRKIIPSKKKIIFVLELPLREKVDEAIIELKNKIFGLSERYGIRVLRDVFSILTSEPIDPTKVAIARFYYDLVSQYMNKSIDECLSRNVLSDFSLGELAVLLFLFFLGNINLEQLVEILNWLYGYDESEVFHIIEKLKDKNLLSMEDSLRIGLNLLSEAKMMKFINELRNAMKICFTNKIVEKPIKLLTESSDIKYICSHEELSRFMNIDVPQNIWFYISKLYGGKTLNANHLRAIIRHLKEVFK